MLIIDWIVVAIIFMAVLYAAHTTRKYTQSVADFLAKAAEEYKAFSLSPAEFVERFYIERKSEHVFGHYSPHGNHWFAFALRPELLKWLSPVPPSYADAG